MALPQKFSISLGGKAYSMKLRWCSPSNCWIVNISDEAGNALVSGIPLVTGAGLLEQFQYLSIPGEMLVQSDNDADAVPTFGSLGITGHLFFLPRVAA